MDRNGSGWRAFGRWGGVACWEWRGIGQAVWCIAHQPDPPRQLGFRNVAGRASAEAAGQCPRNLPESVPTGLTARQLIEQHSSVPECAKCHARIDPYGFALEQYDAIGRLRETKSDTRTILVDGKTIEGIEGLRGYLLNDRRHDIVRQFCRKLLGYSLGRAVQLSDEPLLSGNRAAAGRTRVPLRRGGGDDCVERAISDDSRKVVSPVAEGEIVERVDNTGIIDLTCGNRLNKMNGAGK